jgi:hypothetical protein
MDKELVIENTVLREQGDSIITEDAVRLTGLMRC